MLVASAFVIHALGVAFFIGSLWGEEKLDHRYVYKYIAIWPYALLRGAVKRQ
jgi:hypothetical protein